MQTLSVHQTSYKPPISKGITAKVDDRIECDNVDKYDARTKVPIENITTYMTFYTWDNDCKSLETIPETNEIKRAHDYS